MRLTEMKLGIVEYVGMGSLLLVAGLVALGISTGWSIAIVPGLTFSLAAGAAYMLYRQSRREMAIAGQRVPEVGERETPAGLVPAFRVVGARGPCPLGRRQGEVVFVGEDGKITPPVCPYAEVTLAMAEAEDGKDGIEEWCCPVYDHFLIFRRARERQAA